jgi:hypothetical protein
MGKLYPPYLEGKLPAFVAAENYIEIPFDLNPAVGDSDFTSIKPLIKTISGVEITGIDNASCITKNG